MRKSHTLLISILFFLIVSQSTFANPSIVLYDLRYTLKINTSDSKQVDMSWDHCHAVSTLQGIVNRDAPRLYLKYVDSQILQHKNVDQYWLGKYQKQGQWLHGRAFVPVKTIEKLVNKFRPYIKGAVVYDPAVPATSNVASTIAGADDLIAVRYDNSKDSLYDRLIRNGPKLSVKVWLLNPDGTSKFTGEGKIPDIDRFSTGSAKCDAYLWMKEKYIDTGKCDCSRIGYYIDYFWATKPDAAVLNHHTLSNHDYFVSNRAFFCDLSPWADEPATDDLAQPVGTDRAVFKELLLSAYKQTNGEKMILMGGFPPWTHKYTTFAQGRHSPVGSEWEYTSIISAYNGFQDADAINFGAMANASFWQHFPTKNHYPQEWTSEQQLKQKGYLTDDGKVDFQGREFLIFYVGDYDSSSWLYQRVMDLWDDPARGKVPLMWCISPTISDRAPMAMDYLRQTATSNDYFVAPDSGAGYINPGMLHYSKSFPDVRPISNLPSGLETWAQHCLKYYKKWGLTITGFIIDGFAEGMKKEDLDCYERFSPNGIIWQKGAISYLHNNMPVLRSDWDINDTDPVEAAKKVIKRVEERPIPFHWFRNILKSPSWYLQVNENINKMNPKIELIDAPTFFELFRIYLKNHPDAANGKYDYFESMW